MQGDMEQRISKMVYGSADYLQLPTAIGIDYFYVSADEKDVEILSAKTVSNLSTSQY